MIIFFSDGRFGNQLFQYAFINSQLKENESAYCFNMNQMSDVVIANHPKIHLLKTHVKVKTALKKILKPIIYYTLVKPGIIGYISQSRQHSVSLPTYSEKNGLLPIRLIETNFYQSEFFFKPRNIDFRIKENILSKASHVFEALPADTTKVFVHIRRGDYLKEVFLDQTGIQLPLTYYKNAINMISQEVSNPFFIFLSDDPEYAKQNFNYLSNKYFSNQSMQVDFALMSLCEYGIGSNSSFSWWGAYLMKSRKKVIFPKYWYGWKQKTDSHVGIQPSWAECIDCN
jgi:hypothetical protein